MRSLILLGVLSILLTNCASLKAKKPLKIESPVNVKIYESSSGLGPCEPSIAINLSNPDNLVAGTVLNDVHVSNDGGKTWTTETLRSDLGIWGDPVVISDYKGALYYFHLSDPDGTNWSSKNILDRMVMQKSIDQGSTWSSGTGIGLNRPKQQDKEWAVAHPSKEEIYLAWTEFDKYGSKNPDDHSRILFSKSTNGGATWTDPIKLSNIEGDCLDGDTTTEGAVPAVDKNGNLFVSWSYDDLIYFDRSTDGGVTWLDKDIIVSQQVGGWSVDVKGVNRVNGMPVTVVDNSTGKHDGRIYVNWTDQRNGKNNSDVFIAYSDDMGTTWSPAIRVNQDVTNKEQFFTWMDIDDRTGFIYIVYYDRSKYDNTITDVVLAVSRDGGASFSNHTISDSPFDPTGCSFFGDYNNISVYDGRIRPIWTRYEKGKLSIWTALIDLE